MDDTKILNIPLIHPQIEKVCAETKFTMPSDLYIGSLLKTLIRSKPMSNILELGTGIGLSLSWMIDGLDNSSKLTTIDNNQDLIDNAFQFFGHDKRVTILCEDGAAWIKQYKGEKFDLIFADAWPGKYSETDEILELLKPGGLYILDDMLPQPNWPDNHQANVDKLIDYLEERKDLTLTKMNWSTGIIIAAKTIVLDEK